MKKKYLQLTEDQKKRGVIFSSQLQPGKIIHEVFDKDEDKFQAIERLLNDSFFNGSNFKHNEVRR